MSKKQIDALADLIYRHSPMGRGHSEHLAEVIIGKFDLQQKIIESLSSIVWYDGHYHWLKAMRDELEEILKSGDGYANYHNPFEPNQWHTEQHTIYMFLVGMFGDWGTSIRSGWIEDIRGCIEFIDTICKESWEEVGGADNEC